MGEGLKRYGPEFEANWKSRFGDAGLAAKGRWMQLHDERDRLRKRLRTIEWDMDGLFRSYATPPQPEEAESE